jgi:spore photoproduct lyase
LNQNRLSTITNLPLKEQDFLNSIVKQYRFSFQEQKQLMEMAIDLYMWDALSIRKLWDSSIDKLYQGKKLRSKHLEQIRAYHHSLCNNETDYDTKLQYKTIANHKIHTSKKDNLGFGLCPVASPKTRCCNLLTLDAVESCGFDCSYCSIQSFYNENKIIFDSSLKDKLENIKLDPNEFYHIGTGQSSDSLMWGNHNGILDDLVNFAKKHPNVMLEFKTKSDNISYFINKELPPNLLFTWSLNPQKIIDNEEHLTASLDKRIEAANKLQKEGCLVGFHFHPIIHYKGYKQDYGEIFNTLIKKFDPQLVAMVSFGTLTFIKPVIKKIRSRDFKSKILQIPLTNANGKFSYPLEIKKEIFKFAYDSLKEWHKKVYFYLCMEDHSLWRDVFGYEYPTNESFEMDMKLHYLNKINRNNHK